MSRNTTINEYDDSVEHTVITMRSDKEPYLRAFDEVYHELDKITNKYKPYNSAHEAYGVLAEEVDEFWEIVKQNESKRDYDHLRKEAMQIAAVALRIMVEVTKKD